MSVPPIAGQMPAHYEAQVRGLSPEMVQMRERLQRLEMIADHMQEAVSRSTEESSRGRSELNNRLTSQYQQIAALQKSQAEDNRFIKAISFHLESLQKEIDPLLELQEDMERSAKQKARTVALIKWFAPAIGGILVLLEKLVPGVVSKIWM